MADDQQQAGPSNQPEQQPKDDGKEQKPQGDGKEQKPQGRKRKLSAKRQNTNKRNNGNSDTEVDPDPEKIRFLLDPVLNALRSLLNGNENETMKALIATLQPSQIEIEMALTKVKMDLDRVLGFPNNAYQIYDFGSIKSGLAFRDSDLDFYIHYERNSESKQEQTKLIHIIHGRMLRDGTFHGLVKILGAKVPLLRAIHGPTNLTCDINFSNARGCYNSKFIFAVTRFDPRIHKLAIIIKFWAKCAFLLTNHRQMNTYCIIMMLIFYLQTKKLPLLPAVQDLQKGVPRVAFGPWNLGYPKDIKFTSMNKEAIRMLLQNFFKYYSTFEFEKNLISPFVGRLCAVEEMKQKKVRELQPYYRAVEHQNYPEFNYGTQISIQDPFELNMNIGGVCNSAAHFEQIKLSFKTAHEVMCANNSEPFSKVLENLFTKTKRYQKQTKNAVVSVVSKNGTVPKTVDVSAHWRICRLLPVEYELFIVRQVLLARKTDKEAIITERQIKDVWADCMLDFIEDILQKIYLCKVEPIKDAERASSVPNNIRKEDVRTFELSCERQVIFKRARLQINNEQELNNEIAISKNRWEMNRPLVFSSRVDMFKSNDAIEFHIPEEHHKNGSIRVFIESCFLTQIRKCIKGYFKVMLYKAEEKAKAALETAAMESEGQAQTAQ
ncbi:terminal uridylyltransferase Tailor [Aedes albopictus]|uniref:PAP-associated domain-containing protein n=1 Tax=Aedes albopictus TaxID=7160 RepID=A0ABM1YUC8_AEDAL